MSSKPAHAHETHRVEFKRKLNAELDPEKEVIAFCSSTQDGFVYLGIRFAVNFLPITFRANRPMYADEETVPFTEQVIQEPETRPEARLESQLESKLAARVNLQLNATALGKLALAQGLGHQSVSCELNKQIRRLLDRGLIEYTIPAKPNSRLQQYRLTDKGRSASR